MLSFPILSTITMDSIVAMYTLPILRNGEKVQLAHRCLMRELGSEAYVKGDNPLVQLPLLIVDKASASLMICLECCCSSGHHILMKSLSIALPNVYQDGYLLALDHQTL